MIGFTMGGGKLFSYGTGLFFALFLIFSASDKPLSAAITSVSLSLPSPTSLSDGRGYFCASSTNYYDFTVTVVDPANAVTGITLTIPTQTGTITVTDISPTATGSKTVTGGITASLSSSTGTTSRVNVYRVIFGTSAAASSASNRSITATATDVSSNTMASSQSLYYGICSKFAVTGLTQSGVASDGLVSTTRKDSSEDFTVKGTVVYDIPGYTLESVSDAVTSSDIAGVSCQFGTYSAGASLSGSAFTATVPYNAALPSGKNSWIISGTFAGSAQTFASALSLECNSVVVKTLTFTGGTGRGPTHTGDDLCVRYYRKYGASGTSFTLTAEMAGSYGSGILMHGDTVFTIRATNGTLTLYFPVTISSGKSSVTAVLPYDALTLTGFAVAANATETWTYSVSSVASSSGCNLSQTGDGNGTAVSGVIYWDNSDAPGTVTEIAAAAVQPRATYLTFSWSPLSYTTIPDEDFYEYRIHFRESGGQWKVWTGDNDATLRWPVTSLASGLINGYQTTTIPNLKIFTSYEYYITAVDVFGNESNGGLPPATPVSVKTLPYSIDIALTDGVTRYEETSFADLNPLVRPLKPTAIKVELSITGAEELPETVRIWYSIGDISTTPDMVLIGSPSTINSGAFNDINPLMSETATRSGPNQWVAYLPTTNLVIKAGNNVRFIVETVRNNVSAFSDNIVETTPDPNLAEWTFSITGSTTFTPYPARILNNVITAKHPIAYPSYYLSDDAYVTITVYDVKGRPVVTLLDDAFRHGGVNIKENGWQGRNKAGNKCGIGLYHVHFIAKRVSDGKTILNEFKKLVIAK